MANQKSTARTSEVAEENGWQSLYIVAEHWQSDLKFYDDEIQFLRKLVDRYFMWLTDDQNIDKTRAVASDLIGLEKRKNDITRQVEGHLKDLASMVKKESIENLDRHKDEHAELEESMARLMKDFRRIKKGIFQLTEAIMESEKGRHVLGS